MDVISAHRNKKWNRSTNYTACTFPLMRRCCMGAHAGPAGISSFSTVVTADFTDNSDRSAPQLGTAIRIHESNAGPPDGYIKPKMVHATSESLNNWSRENCVTG